MKFDPYKKKEGGGDGGQILIHAEGARAHEIVRYFNMGDWSFRHTERGGGR